MTRIFASLTLFVLALALSVSAFAAGKTKTFTLYHDAQLNGTTIPAGEYTVAYDENGSTADVKFMKGKKEVASATGQVKQLDKKTNVNMLRLDHTSATPSIAEIDLGGTSTGIAFESNATAAGK